MEFNFIDYKIFKTKKILKYIEPLFFFSGTRLKSKSWLLVEQALVIKKLKYYKIYNITANIIIKNSIFNNNYELIVNGSTIFTNFNLNFLKNKKINPLVLSAKLTNTHSLLTFLFTKLNNKFYSYFQTSKLKLSIYENNLLILKSLLKMTMKKNLINYF